MNFSDFYSVCHFYILRFLVMYYLYIGFYGTIMLCFHQKNRKEDNVSKTDCQTNGRVNLSIVEGYRDAVTKASTEW